MSGTSFELAERQYRLDALHPQRFSRTTRTSCTTAGGAAARLDYVNEARQPIVDVMAPFLCLQRAQSVLQRIVVILRRDLRDESAALFARELDRLHRPLVQLGEQAFG